MVANCFEQEECIVIISLAVSVCKALMQDTTYTILGRTGRTVH